MLISHSRYKSGKNPFGWYKCNVDVAFHKEEMKTSAGWCVRGRNIMESRKVLYYRRRSYSIAGSNDGGSKRHHSRHI
ncbi:hypothetical protein L195_g016068 [Trifolium pratense]|uniref:Uncharacterized protein n=1 Tax=Trifolium pratense TaxID=57577 RepID=A0A2K3MQ90_TRIPR|nr:hypothetical protein L195_g016068 [Trifolium pratense]